MSKPTHTILLVTACAGNFGISGKPHVWEETHLAYQRKIVCLFLWPQFFTTPSFHVPLVSRLYRFTRIFGLGTLNSLRLQRTNASLKDEFVLNSVRQTKTGKPKNFVVCKCAHSIISWLHGHCIAFFLSYMAIAWQMNILRFSLGCKIAVRPLLTIALTVLVLLESFLTNPYAMKERILCISRHAFPPSRV